MNTKPFRLSIALVMLASMGAFETPSAEAGVIPWSYNAIFGQGPIFPRMHAYRAGYAPNYGYGAAPMTYGANYGYRGSYGWRTNYAGYGGGVVNPLPEWPAAPAGYTSYYGPGFGVSSFGGNCGCNPCGYSNCGSCGSNCATGDCATTGSNYNPEPVADTKSNDSKVTPTFKPTPMDEKPVVPETNDDFVPITRNEKDGDYKPPVHNNSPANTESVLPNTSGLQPVTPDNSVAPASGTDILPNLGDSADVPIGPLGRPMAPAIENTIPGVGDGSVLPNIDSTPPTNNRPFPGTEGTPGSGQPQVNPGIQLNKPATSEPSEGATPDLIDSQSQLRSIEIPTSSEPRLVVERKRVVMQAGYRIPSLKRIDVPAQPIRDTEAAKLAVR